MRSLLVEVAAAGVVATAAIYGTSLIGAVVHYRMTAIQRAAPISLRGLALHLFPADVVRGQWLRADFLIYLSNKLLLALVFPSTSALTVLTATGVRSEFVASGITPVAIVPGAISICIFVLGSLLVRDFAVFYIHLLQHRIPVLWEFHKVHHAPESLSPLTSHCLHPLELFINVTAESLLLGLLAGTNAWITVQQPTHLIASATGLYVVINMITFSPLRHSHIDLRLGRFELIFLSPAHHRVHHSAERLHWDKNFGAIFPLWDWLWGTLAGPQRPDSYRLGLPDGGSKAYLGIWRSYVTPFREIRRGWREMGVLPTFRIGAVEKRPPSRTP
jgi:sterol desaturase/sphingolipid hydroxylase (fatty acid hydroxylase superfamily)